MHKRPSNNNKPKTQPSQQHHTLRPLQHRKLSTNKRPLKSTTQQQHQQQHNIIHDSSAFQQSSILLNSKRDKFAEAVLNIPKPQKTEQQLLSTRPVSNPGDVMPTGANLAPVRNRSNKDGYDMAKVKNKIPMPPEGALTQAQIARRKLFFNTFPRSAASPAGPKLQTAYTNYSVYKGIIDYSKRLPGCDIKISVKERPDYTTLLDTRWYAEAMSKPRARVELRLHQFSFLTRLERDLLGEILGPRHNWQNSSITISITNLREIYPSINRCFQLLHEAAFRAIEIAPTILAQTNQEYSEFNTKVKAIQEEEAKLNASLKSSTPHFTRATAPQQQFLTTDNQHFIPYNPEFSMEDHLKYIPAANFQNYLVTDKVPPGMAKPLQKLKDVAPELLQSDPTRNPDEPVSPGINPYTYGDRVAIMLAAQPTLDGEFKEKRPSLEKIYNQFASVDLDHSSDDERILANAIVFDQLNAVDVGRARKQLRDDRDFEQILANTEKAEMDDVLKHQRVHRDDQMSDQEKH